MSRRHATAAPYSHHHHQHQHHHHQQQQPHQSHLNADDADDPQDEEFGIQLTDRQRQWKHRLEQKGGRTDENEVPSVSSLASSASNAAAPSIHPKNQLLTKHLTSAAAAAASTTAASSTISAATTTTTTTAASSTTKLDQKALLRKVLQKSMAKKKRLATTATATTTAATTTTTTRIPSLLDLEDHHQPPPLKSPLQVRISNHQQLQQPLMKQPLMKQPPVVRSQQQQQQRPPTTAATAAVSRVAATARGPGVAKKSIKKSPLPATAATTLSTPAPPYDEFMKTLQQEVAGDHTELWRSFRSLFGISSHNSSNNSNKRSKVKFDSPTKKVLHNMNLHLKKSTKMECQPETQLVNDGRLKKKQLASKQPALLPTIKTNHHHQEEGVVAKNLFHDLELAKDVVEPAISGSGGADTTEGWVHFGANAETRPQIVAQPAVMEHNTPAATKTTNALFAVPPGSKPVTSFYSLTKPVTRTLPPARTNESTTTGSAPPTPAKPAETRMPLKSTTGGGFGVTGESHAAKTPAPTNELLSAMAARIRANQALKTQGRPTTVESNNTAPAKTPHLLGFKTPAPLRTVHEETTLSGRKRHNNTDNNNEHDSNRNIMNAMPWSAVQLRRSAAVANNDESTRSAAAATASAAPVVPWSNVKLRSDTKQSKVGLATGIQWITVDDLPTMPTVKEEVPIVFSPDFKDRSRSVPPRLAAPPPRLAAPPLFVPRWQDGQQSSSSSSSTMTVKLKSIQSRTETAVPEESDDGTIPWAAVKLKATTAHSRSANVGQEECDDENGISSWGSIKLKATHFNKTCLEQEVEEEPEESRCDLEIPSLKSRPTPKPVASFVPVRLSEDRCDENGIPWAAVKLKATHSNNRTDVEGDCDENGIPWGAFKLKATHSNNRANVEGDCDENGIPWAAVKLKATHSNNRTDVEGDCDENGIPWAAFKLKATHSNKMFLEDDRKEPQRELEAPASKPRPTPKPVTSFVPKPLSEDRCDENGIPWGAVKLKSASIATTDATEDSNASWLKVKLRSVDHDESEHQTSAGDNDRLLPFREMLRKVPTDEIPTKPTQSALSQSASKQKVQDDECGIHIGDEIDLLNLPVNVLGSADAPAIVLQRHPGMPEQDCETIIAGKTVLVMTRRNGDENVSRVTWRIPRSKVQSLTLEMAENRADLSLADGSTKGVYFASAESCLQFANAFYLTNRAKDVDPAAQFKKDRESAAAAQQASEAAEQAIGQVLNEEEQQLLEKYRAMRKTKAADEALRDAIPDVGNSSSGEGTKSGPQSMLSEDDEKVAAAYRKMLQLRIPLEAVEHKMKKDGVSESILQAVLNPTAVSVKPQGSSDTLSPDEDKIAAAYRKMLKLSIPPEAVEHKMKKDQVGQNIINAVLSAFSNATPNESEAPVPSQKPKQENSLSEDEEKIASTYRKMLKMMIPADAVKHKMKKDQIDSKIVYALFPDEAPKASPTPDQTTAIVLSNEEEAVAKTYRRMLQMMIPADAVRHKMTKDNIDNKIVLVVLGPNPDDKKGKALPDALSEDEEKIANSYRKMLKMMIPPEAVRHKMQKDGVSEKIAAAVLGDDSKDAKSTAAQSKLRGSNLVALQWTPLSGEELDNSVWRASKKRRVTSTEPEGNEFAELVKLFQKKSNPKGGQGALLSSDAAGVDSKAKLIDITRANNVAISLKAFKEFTHKEIASIISHLDPHRLICGERVQFMKDLLPTASEAKSVQNYKGLDSRLITAELFFREVVRVERIETKVHVMQTMDVFNENATQLKINFQLLARACLQVQRSERLEYVLDEVLKVGNIMNEGTRTGGASGFKFDSLLKLTQTKSSDGKTTVLDYMVMIFVAKEDRETLKLAEDFPDCQAASRMLISDMVGEVTEMVNTLKKCKDELKLLKDQVSGSQAPKAAAGPSKAGGSGDPRADMFAAIKARNRDDGDASQPTNPRANFLAAIQGRGESKGNGTASIIPKSNVSNARDNLLQMIKARSESENLSGPTVKKTTSGVNAGGSKKSSGSILDALTGCTNPDISSIDSSDEEKKDAEEPVTPKMPEIKEGTLSDGMARLEQFITDADIILKGLLAEKTKSLKACKDLSKYCGESGGERVTSTLLGILSQFATNLSAAVEKHDNRKEAEARKEAASQKQLTSIVPSNPVQPSATNLKKLLESKSTSSSQPPDFPGSPLSTVNKSVSLRKHSATHKTSFDSAVSALFPPTSPAPRTPGKDETKKLKAPGAVKSRADSQSLVLMVNKMLKAAPTNVKDDFAKGVVYANPADPALHRIYEKEQSLGGGVLSPRPTQLDIMSAIKKRRERAERVEET